MPRLRFLGTGTSTGVPQIGCHCEVCCSTDLCDKRLRTSAMLSLDNGAHILIDCGPDFRQQMLRWPYDKIDAVLITHEHYDHVGGIDDLRPFSFRKSIDVYANERCAHNLKQRISYCFAEKISRRSQHIVAWLVRAKIVQCGRRRGCSCRGVT